jgi:hypothetical protein
MPFSRASGLQQLAFARKAEDPRLQTEPGSELSSGGPSRVSEGRDGEEGGDTFPTALQAVGPPTGFLQPHLQLVETWLQSAIVTLWSKPWLA